MLFFQILLVLETQKNNRMLNENEVSDVSESQNSALNRRCFLR